MGYRASLILTLAFMVVLRVGLDFAIRYLLAFLYALPV